MGKKVIFTITTNATLLKESIVEFFVEKINGEFKISENIIVNFIKIILVLIQV